jgi:hypothetical protein
MTLFITFTEAERGLAGNVGKMKEEMALTELLAGGNKVTELRNSVTVSFKMKCKWVNQRGKQKRGKKENND